MGNVAFDESIDLCCDIDIIVTDDGDRCVGWVFPLECRLSQKSCEGLRTGEGSSRICELRQVTPRFPKARAAESLRSSVGCSSVITTAF